MGMQKSRVEVWGDVTDQFSILKEQLVYVDAPFEGFLRSHKTSELFAFRCFEVIDKVLWHWVLLPASSTEVKLDEIFVSARTSPPKRWLSVVEDQRGEEPQLYAAWLSGDEHVPPIK
jgi:hypothetical protein